MLKVCTILSHAGRMGWTPNLAFLPYGERFKKHRAIFHFFKFLAMLLYPECQKRGQDEVDCVIGKYMLPSFDDIESLPYVNCVVQEVFRFVVFILSKGGVVLKGLYIRRWKPVIPLRSCCQTPILRHPHRCTEDDNYRGMLIPKGSLVFANAMYAICPPSSPRHN